MDPRRVVVMGSMPELAQYVYQDYHIRIDALRAKVTSCHHGNCSVDRCMHTIQMGGGSASLAPPPEQIEATPLEQNETHPTETVEEGNSGLAQGGEKGSQPSQVASTETSLLGTVDETQSNDVQEKDSGIDETSTRGEVRAMEERTTRGEEREMEETTTRGEVRAMEERTTMGEEREMEETTTRGEERAMEETTTAKDSDHTGDIQCNDKHSELEQMDTNN